MAGLLNLKNCYKAIGCIQLIAALALFSPVSKAQIIESPNIAEVVSHVDKDTLVLFDVDNTLIQLPQFLGTPEWFSDFHKKKVAAGELAEKATKETVTTYILVNQNSAAIPVDPQTSKIIARLQAQGIHVLGLTSRDDVLSQATFRQLKSVGINLNHGRFGRHLIKLAVGEKSKVQGGIIFTGGKNKGHCLEEFLAITRLTPKKILFIDDQIKALQEVETILAKNNINYIGIRYSYLDFKSKVFNSEVAEAQLSHFRKTGRLLSDNEALTTLAKKVVN